jgi:PAS domain S-box-containing protein
MRSARSREAATKAKARTLPRGGLRPFNERFRRLADLNPGVMVVYDPERRIRFINAQGIKVSGLAESTILGRRDEELFPPSTTDSFLPTLIKAVETRAPQSTEVALPGGQVNHIRVVYWPITDGRGEIIEILGVTTDRGEWRRLSDQLEERSVQLARLASELTMSAQRERRRLAEALHDHLQQLLVGARMQMHSLLSADSKRRDHRLEQIYELLGEALAASRSVILDLAPPVPLARDPMMGFRWLARDMRRRHHLQVRLSLPKRLPPMAEGILVLLFTAGRELLLNVAKHSGVLEARMRLSVDALRVNLTISDRGRGFPRSTLLQGRHPQAFGLFSIRERAELLGGDLLLEAAPDGGARVTLCLPLVPAPAEAAPPESTRPPPARTSRKQRPPAAPRGSGPAPIRLVFADDHHSIRHAIVSLVRSQPGFQVVGEASDGEEAIACVKRLRPDVVVMDVSMPRLDGIEATRFITESWPEVRVVGFSFHDEPAIVKRMREAGAAEYVTKSASPERLLEAILRSARRPRQGTGSRPL